MSLLITFYNFTHVSTIISSQLENETVRKAARGPIRANSISAVYRIGVMMMDPWHFVAAPTRRYMLTPVLLLPASLGSRPAEQMPSVTARRWLEGCP